MCDPRRLDQAFVEQIVQMGPTAWIFDLDGTLIDLAPEPDMVQVPDTLLADLTHLRQHQNNQVAIVSGRSLADLMALLPLPDLTLVGNHGAEGRINGERYLFPPSHAALDGLQRLLPDLSTLRDQVPGLIVENKTWTISVHVRQVSSLNHVRVREQLSTLLAPEPALTLRPAKDCYEVRPLGGQDKGQTVQRLRQVWGPHPTLFVFGDDYTDEDSFQAAGPEAITVIIGDRRPTRARYALPTPKDMRKLLHEIRRLGGDGPGIA